MKVLIFNTLYYPNQIGGAEKSVQLLAEGLSKYIGIDVVIITTSDKDFVDYVNGIKVYYIKTVNFYWALRSKEKSKLIRPLWHVIDSFNPFTKKIEKVFLEEAPDVIHTNNLAGFSVYVWHLAKKNNIRIVHTLRDYYLLCPKSTMFNNGNNCESQCVSCRFYSIPKKQMSKYVDAIVGISMFILNKHLSLNYFNNAIQSVIYNSVTLPKKINKGKRNYYVIGFVGTLSSNKGVEVLLDNFLELKRDNVKLFLYGKGEENYERYLRSTYGQNDKVYFKGYRSSDDIYSNIDLLVVPSIWNEPFGRVVPEANSYNVPVLVSNRGGLIELVRDGVNGYVFSIDNKYDLKNKLEYILDSLDKSGFEFDTKSFSLKRIAYEYSEIYLKVLR